MVERVQCNKNSAVAGGGRVTPLLVLEQASVTLTSRQQGQPHSLTVAWYRVLLELLDLTLNYQSSIYEVRWNEWTVSTSDSSFMVFVH